MKINRRAFLLAGAGWGLSGCELPRTPQKKDSMPLLSRPKTSENAIGIEFALVLVPPYRHRLLEDAWEQMDQQAIDVATRKRLVHNGVRAGNAGRSLPQPLRSLMRPLPIAEDQLTEIQLQMLRAGKLQPEGVVRQHTRLTLHPGQPRDLGITAARPQIAWVWHSDHGRSHHRYQDATSKIRVSILPAAGTVIDIGVLPMIAHGPMLPQYEAQSTDRFSYAVGQSEALIQDAAIKARLQLGETLVLGPTFPARDDSASQKMGSVFFRDDGRLEGDHLVLLRLLEARFNDLYSDPTNDATFAFTAPS